MEHLAQSASQATSFLTEGAAKLGNGLIPEPALPVGCSHLIASPAPPLLHTAVSAGLGSQPPMENAVQMDNFSTLELQLAKHAPPPVQPVPIQPLFAQVAMQPTLNYF